MRYTAHMDFFAIYHFIFETYAGIGILIGAGLIISLILAVVLEKRTRKIYKDRPKPEDGWSFFDDDDDDEDGEGAASEGDDR